MRRRWLLLAAGAGLLQAGLTAADAPTMEQALPLKVARQVQFQTDEGTWMGVDLAPNGKTILFDLLGELYTVDVAGGPAKRLLGGLAFESQARYSPDGKHIAFISDRSGNQNLWIADADGSGLRQLSQAQGDPSFSAPIWSADGKSIYVNFAAKLYAAVGIWKYDVASATGTVLAPPKSAPERLAIGPAPSADGHYVYFASASEDSGNQYGSLPVWKIVRRDLRTDQEVTVVHAPGSAMHPVLSPNGQRLVYATRVDGQTGLRLRDLVSGADRWLAYPVQFDAQATSGFKSSGLMPIFTFTADGSALLLSLNGKIQRMQIDSGAATAIAFTADISLDVGPRLQFDQKISDGLVRARVIQSPQQSPDGRDLAFSALGSVYVMRLPNGTPRRLAEGFQPSWSADGRSIAYVSWQAGDGGHVWRVSARGGTPQRLTQASAYYTEPVFDSTGKTVYVLRSSAYEQSQVEKSDLYVNRVADIVRLGADGTSTTVISQELQLSGLRFSPDSGRLSFESEGRSVQSMSTDGTDRRTHVSVRGPESNVPVLLSPDQRWALAQAGGQLYLFAVTADGGTVDLNDSAMQRWRISELGADYFAWADGGKTITWALGHEFHRVRLDKIDRTIRERDTPAALRGTENFSVRVEVPRDMPQGTLVLRGAAAITMKGDEVIDDADVVIVNNRIAAVGRSGQVTIPKDAVVRDVKGRFIVPGFIDTHAHWLHSRFDVLDLQAWTFNINLAHGVTAGLDPQSFTQDVFAYGDMIDAGLITGQRAFSTGRGI
ncbi:hypothetical protein, partial [Steroidobacter sp.]|uniref:hypothetical protein n=1 Tax=Steroidobacter sp. TaxID=1978227 RepID=UPI001A5D468A